MLRRSISTSVSIHMHSIHTKKCSENLIKIIKLIISCGVCCSVMMTISRLLLLFRSESVISFFLLRIYEDCVCIWNLFKYLFGTFIKIWVYPQNCFYLDGSVMLTFCKLFWFTFRLLFWRRPKYRNNLFSSSSLRFTPSFLLISYPFFNSIVLTNVKNIDKL